jgi:hypothetical protein
MAIEAATRALSVFPVIAILTSASIACGAYCLDSASSPRATTVVHRRAGVPFRLKVHLTETVENITIKVVCTLLSRHTDPGVHLL